MKKITLLFIVILLLNSVYAVDMADAKGNINEASSDISAFFSGVERQDFLIVTVSKISVEDRLLFNMLKSNIPEVQGRKISNDDQVDDPNLNTLILLGSAKTNSISKSKG